MRIPLPRDFHPWCMKPARIVVWALIAAAMTALPAGAEPTNRVAVVFGNDRYQNLPRQEQLDRAEDDASSVAKALSSIGYRVILKLNATQREMNGALDQAEQEIRPGATVLIYYAGHGVEISGANYLIPTDVPRPQAADAPTLVAKSLALSEILGGLQAHGSQTNIIILDACRDNPFSARTRGPGGARGLGRIEAPSSGFFMIYSAGIAQSAMDRLPGADNDPNSVFTRVLLRYLGRPELPLAAIAKGLQHDVSQLARSVNEQQTPAYYDQLNGDYTLLGADVSGETRFADVSPPVSPPGQVVTNLRTTSIAAAAPTLRVGIKGWDAQRLLHNLAGTRGIDIHLAADNDDLLLNADTGGLTDGGGRPLYLFRAGEAVETYRRVLRKWMLVKLIRAKAVSNRLDVRMDGARDTLANGERFSISVAAEPKDFICAFDIAADGSVATLSPSQADGDCEQSDEAGRYLLNLEASPPFGADQVVVIGLARPSRALSRLIGGLNGRAPDDQDVMAMSQFLSNGSASVGDVSFVVTEGRR